MTYDLEPICSQVFSRRLTMSVHLLLGQLILNIQLSRSFFRSFIGCVQCSPSQTIHVKRKMSDQCMQFGSSPIVAAVEFVQDYQDPSVDSTVTDGHWQGKKA